jgi:hypothetical protein
MPLVDSTANTLDCRVLLGWMSGQQAVHFLLNECRMERAMSIGQAEDLWKEYRARVEELPSRAGAPVRTFQLDAANRAIQQEFLEAHPEASDVTGFTLIHPLDLQVHQLQIVTDSSLGLASEIQRNGWLKTALLREPENHPIRWRAEQSQLVFELPHPEFALTAPAPPDARMRIVPLPAWVSVAKFEDRTLLVNGYHRTFAAASRMHFAPGDRRENSLLFPVSSVLPFPDPPNRQTREELLGPRPPRFADFFDRSLALPVKLPRHTRYEMRVKVEIAGVRVEEKTLNKPGTRSANA